MGLSQLYNLSDYLKGKKIQSQKINILMDIIIVQDELKIKEKRMKMSY